MDYVAEDNKTGAGFYRLALSALGLPASPAPAHFGIAFSNSGSGLLPHATAASWVLRQAIVNLGAQQNQHLVPLIWILHGFNLKLPPLEPYLHLRHHTAAAGSRANVFPCNAGAGVAVLRNPNVRLEGRRDWGYWQKLQLGARAHFASAPARRNLAAHHATHAAQIQNPPHLHSAPPAPGQQRDADLESSCDELIWGRAVMI
jgi:hypothetical protein